MCAQSHLSSLQNHRKVKSIVELGVNGHISHKTKISQLIWIQVCHTNIHINLISSKDKASISKQTPTRFTLWQEEKSSETGILATSRYVLLICLKCWLAILHVHVEGTSLHFSADFSNRVWLWMLYVQR